MMKSFADLFQGRDDVYGVYDDIGDSLPTDRGKRVAKARTVAAPVTKAMYQDHTDGVRRLGIVPIRNDGSCSWFVIDVDFYQGEVTHPDIAQRIKQAGLPLVQTKSKSGGAHLICFIASPIPAAKARNIAMSFLERLHLPGEHIEIFPKQDSLGPGEMGSWINLPYFGKTCYAVGPTGDGELDLEEFLAYANENIVFPQDLNIIKKERAYTARSPNPPCINTMLKDGVGEGGRNDAIVQYAIFAKKAYPDDWREKTTDFNSTKCDPPLSKAELKEALRSMASREYQYLCGRFTNICDKQTCLTRQFGIGTETGDTGIEHIEKIEGEEPIYRITMANGKRFQCSADEFLAYRLFKSVVFRDVDRVLPNRKQADWEEEVKALLVNMEISKAAQDTQNRERIWNHFKEWAAQGCLTTTLEDALLSGVCYYDGENLIFRGEDFMKTLDRTVKIARSKMYIYLRDFGVIQNSYRVRNQNIPLWAYVSEEPLWFDPFKGKRE